MTAREKFAIGQRVQMSDEGKYRFPRRADDYAVVVGFGWRDFIVRVRRNGLKTPEAFHMDFWEPALAANEKTA